MLKFYLRNLQCTRAWDGYFMIKEHGVVQRIETGRMYITIQGQENCIKCGCRVCKEASGNVRVLEILDPLTLDGLRGYLFLFA